MIFTIFAAVFTAWFTKKNFINLFFREGTPTYWFILLVLEISLEGIIIGFAVDAGSKNTKIEELQQGLEKQRQRESSHFNIVSDRLRSTSEDLETITHSVNQNL
mmetsp:Transcript_4402/g.6976  ORF Transcript_4402/g.6976 Transcript_4402/m.6976 type:complete len:104 (+) Transcript_4402:118-429(+)